MVGVSTAANLLHRRSRRRTTRLPVQRKPAALRFRCEGPRTASAYPLSMAPTQTALATGWLLLVAAALLARAEARELQARGTGPSPQDKCIKRPGTMWSGELIADPTTTCAVRADERQM